MTELSLHILDIVQNSIRANAHTIRVVIVENYDEDSLKIIIEDDGDGMDKVTLEQVTDPFYTTRTTRKVGMGIALLKQHAEMTGGHFSIWSEPKKGCKTEATFVHSSIDRQPLGDIAGTMTILIGSNSSKRLLYTHKTAKGQFYLDTEEIKKELGGISIEHPDIRRGIEELIKNNLEEIKISR